MGTEGEGEMREQDMSVRGRILSGRRVAVGGMDGVITVFEVGGDLGGVETRGDEWSGVKRLVGRLEGVGEGVNGK